MAAAVALQVKHSDCSATLVLHNHIAEMTKAGTLLIEHTKTLIACERRSLTHP
ncbi:Unknown protein sequence [Pseudomonas coronafaciens pv. oryzae]|nr:Unknown protein sequence [Pseudomonas coronafaciens pv. oryzae]